MSQPAQTLRQLVDWRAAAWAGLASGVFSLVVNSILTGLTLGSPWLFTQMAAGILLGGAVLEGAATPTFATVLAGLLVHLALSLAFAALLAFIIHRWGMAVGVLGGAAFGLALYAINIYTLSAFFPWFYGLRNWMMLASHVVYGALAGGLYELWEVEVFVPREEPK